MNKRMILYTVGYMLIVEALLMMLPALVAIIYGEEAVWAFLITAGIAAMLGYLLIRIFRPKSYVIYAREGFVIVSLAWIGVSLFGALPFTISREIPFYIDAVFEMVSGFTTTGASILRDVESLSHAALFWRSFSHWIGGMGVLVFIMAVIPNLSDRSIHIMRAEMPGPEVGKIVPRAKDTAKILYLIYIVMTVIQVILLCLGGMPLFDSLLHTFGSAGTGGFGIKSDSIAGYNPYCQWVITIFMVLFGVNFNLYYLLLLRRVKAVLKSTELWSYIGIIVASATLITVNILPKYENIGDAVRNSAFQVSSIITTTGYTTADYDTWPQFSKGILLLLMFIGACAGSTGGGLKVSRLVMLVKSVSREIRRLLHPRSVSVVRMEGRPVGDAVINGVTVYFAVYMCCFFALFLLLCINGFDIETNFSATAACFNNIGPGMGAVGPTLSYADYSPFSKLALSFGMLLGRLEIFPLIITFSPSVWFKK